MMGRGRARHRFVERTACPSCGSRRIECLYDRRFADPPVRDFLVDYYGADPDRFADQHYTLDRCEDCSLIFQRWIGDPEFHAELYGEWIGGHGSPQQDPTYRRDIDAPLQSRDGHEILTIGRFLGKRPSELKLLDYGMGWALWARIAKKMGCDVSGVEMSAERGAFAQEHGIRLLSDAELAGEDFDFINTDQLFEHVANPNGLAQRLSRSLKPGGILKISVPNCVGAGDLVRRIEDDNGKLRRDEWMPVQPLEHINSFSDASIAVLARQCGLEIVEPSILEKFAFLTRPSAVPVRPRQLAKELARPFYSFRNRRNLCRWLRMPKKLDSGDE